MRIALAASALCLLAFTGPPVAAADQILVAKTCGMTITSRVVAGGRRCTQLLLRRDVAGGRMDIAFDFPDGFKLDISGPALSLSPQATVVTPDRITWANAGQTTPQVDANTPGAAVIKGRCVIKAHRDSTEIGTINCRLGSPLGRIDVEVVTPRP